MKNFPILALLLLVLACGEDEEVKIQKDLSFYTLNEIPVSGDQVSLKGENLDLIDSALFNGVKLQVASSSATQYTFNLPESSGSGQLEVFYQEFDVSKTEKFLIKVLDDQVSVVDIDISTPSKIEFFSENFGLIHANGAIFKTTDGGATWNMILEKMGINTYDLFPVFDENFIMVPIYTSPKLIVSENGGDTWKEFDPFSDDYRVESYLPLTSDSIIAITSNSDLSTGNIFVSSNSGKDFVEVAEFDYDLARKFQPLSVFNDLVSFIDPESSKMIISKDFGKSWELKSLPIRLYPLAPAIDFVNSDLVFAYKAPLIDTSGPGLVKSEDGGENWSSVLNYESIIDWNIVGCKAVDENKIVFVDNEGGYYITEDGGETWKLYYLDSSVSSFICFGGNTAYYWQGGRIIKKTF
ncbi:WD40/YVTN/BNR-like repeat-containing protein [Mangrovivirga cuniculi]|uniref:Photosynthesis system II assembly factor Ycf48/Hcf136-like domain-containing protein n=1 Tax=Mangrovivirga cuniculi TaxID=2715131 RepID=A0A4D7JMQ0_9BACT|nr:hypothetical protein [Mangrovivirga cuniculi]QCK16881.1 hypothetical protein DCC35_20160 [Mangrovivirga cuniculi]